MIFDEEYMEPLFTFLERCKGVKQMEKWHPEGDAYNHMLQVLHHAFRETNDTDLIIAAMLHDIGKFEMTKGHEERAVEWLKPYCSVKTLWLIEQHMRFWYYIEGKMRKMGKCKDFVGHPWFIELCQLARWDKLGRNPSFYPKYDRDEIINKLNKAGMSRLGVR